MTIPVDGFVDRKTELQSECLAAKIGFGRAENEPSKIGQEIGNMILLYIIMDGMDQTVFKPAKIAPAPCRSDSGPLGPSRIA